MKPRRRALALIVAAALVACGGSATEPRQDPPEIEEPEPEPVDPGPTDVVILSAQRLQNDDVVTSLENRGGPGTFYLRFIGTALNQPSGQCAPHELGESDDIQVDSSYAETVTWGFEGDLVKIVVAYSRPTNSAAWTETDRFYISCLGG